MINKFVEYASRQKKFWNVPSEHEARFSRVDTISRSTDEHQKLAEWAVTKVLEDMSLNSDFAVLELGCGVGRIISLLQRNAHFSKLIGVDISEKMIEYCRKNTVDDPRISLYVNSGYDLSMIASGSIDFAYSVDVFIHIFDIDVALNYLKEVRRILKVGRDFRFNVRVWDPEKAFANTIGGRTAKYLYRFGLRSTGKHRWSPDQAAEFNGNQYTPKEIRSLINRAGLAPISIKPDGDHLWCTARKPS